MKQVWVLGKANFTYFVWFDRAFVWILMLLLLLLKWDMFVGRCSRLGLVAIAYLWRRDQGELLQEMVDCQINAIIIKVAALGLDPAKHLGLRISSIQPHLIKMVSFRV